MKLIRKLTERDIAPGQKLENLWAKEDSLRRSGVFVRFETKIKYYKSSEMGKVPYNQDCVIMESPGGIVKIPNNIQSRWRING
jgi:hypothetical protein